MITPIAVIQLIYMYRRYVIAMPTSKLERAMASALNQSVCCMQSSYVQSKHWLAILLSNMASSGHGKQQSVTPQYEGRFASFSLLYPSRVTKKHDINSFVPHENLVVLLFVPSYFCIVTTDKHTCPKCCTASWVHKTVSSGEGATLPTWKIYVVYKIHHSSLRGGQLHSQQIDNLIFKTLLLFRKSWLITLFSLELWKMLSNK